MTESNTNATEWNTNATESNTNATEPNTNAMEPNTNAMELNTNAMELNALEYLLDKPSSLEAYLTKRVGPIVKERTQKESLRKIYNSRDVISGHLQQYDKQHNTNYGTEFLGLLDKFKEAFTQASDDGIGRSTRGNSRKNKDVATATATDETSQARLYAECYIRIGKFLSDAKLSWVKEHGEGKKTKEPWKAVREMEAVFSGVIASIESMNALRKSFEFVLFEDDNKKPKPAGEGSFGSVFLVKEVATGKHFALKVLKIADGKSRFEKQQREAQILERCSNNPVSQLCVECYSGARRLSGFFRPHTSTSSFLLSQRLAQLHTSRFARYGSWYALD